MNPLAHGFEPASGVCFKPQDLFLCRPLFRHECVLPLKVSVALYVLLNVEVGDTGELLVHVAHAHTQGLNGRRRSCLYVLLVLGSHTEQFGRPILGHDVAREQRGELRGECFFAYERLATRHTFLGTAIVDVAFLRLGRDGAATLAAREQATKGLRLVLLPLGLAAQFQHSLYLVEKLLADERLVLSLVHLSGVPEVSVVEGIGEHGAHLVAFPRLVASFTPPLRRSRLDAVVEQETAHVLQARSVLCVQLEGADDDGSFSSVYGDSLGARVVEVAERSDGRIVSVAGFLPQAPRGVRAQVADVLVGDAKLNAHEEHVVGRIVVACGSADMPNCILL